MFLYSYLLPIKLLFLTFCGYLNANSIIISNQYDCIFFPYHRESIKLGVTEFTEDELNEIIREMGNRFTGQSYHLVDK